MADVVFPVALNGRPTVRPDMPASAGGQGAFSYLDTKVYGPRQQRQPFTRTVYVYNRVTGQPDLSQSIPTGKLIIPGTGGSAKAPGRRYFGSRAIGFKPEGLVLIRLIKI